MPIAPNQSSEQRACDHIDQLLVECGCVAQDYDRLNLAAGSRVALGEYKTEAGPATYSGGKPSLE